jgi:thioredoxin reductase
MDSFHNHALESGSEIIQDTVALVDKKDDLFTVKTISGKEFISKSVIYAT